MLILAVPDLHCGFEHPDAWDFLRDVYKDVKPDKVVCLGDEWDCHAISDHGSDPNGMSPGEELEDAKRAMKNFYKIFKGPVQFCTSNHSSRPFRRAFKAGLPTQFLRDYREFLDAPKEYVWKDEWVFDGVLYFHGEPYAGQNAAIKAARDHRQSCVIGHVHSHAGVQYSRTRNGQIFGMNAGCLIDEERYAFRYGKKYANRPSLGCGIVEDGKTAHFLPLEAWQ